MKLSRLVPPFVALSILSAACLLHAEEDSPLEGKMKILARGMRQLSGQVSDPSKQQENVSLLETLRQAAEDSKSLDPRKTGEIPDAKRPAFLADYRSEMDRLKAALNEVEEAVKAGQYEKAKSLIDAVNAIKKEGHGKFKAD